jgi:hypothetical protein
MALLELNLKPSERELRWFGALLLLFFAIVGALVYRAGVPILSMILWIIGAALGSLFYFVQPLRGPIYRGWVRATYPIGWLISHALLATIYYAVLTPLGLVFRLFGRDPLQRSLTQAESYWQEHRKELPVSRYFRQF